MGRRSTFDTFFTIHQILPVVPFQSEAAVRQLWGSVAVDVTLTDQEVFMESPAQEGSAIRSITASSSSRPRARRGSWVMTAYAVSGLALFGLLAYFFSNYITQ